MKKRILHTLAHAASAALLLVAAACSDLTSDTVIDEEGTIAAAATESRNDGESGSGGGTDGSTDGTTGTTYKVIFYDSDNTTKLSTIQVAANSLIPNDQVYTKTVDGETRITTWYTDKTTKTAEKEWKFASDKLTKERWLYAGDWTAQDYKAVFHANADAGGSGDDVTLWRTASGSYGGITLPEEPDGFTNSDGNAVFARWTSGETDDAGEPVTYEPGTNYTLTADADFYAVWVAPVTVTFSANVSDDSVQGTMEALVGADSYTLTANAYTRDGYLFIGWNTEADGSGTAYADGAETGILNGGTSGTITLYAQWKKLGTVSFDGNTAYANGTVSGSTASVLTGDRFTLPASGFTHSDSEHYVFSQWNTEADGSGIGYLAGDTVTLSTTLAACAGEDGTIILYAQWAQKVTLAEAVAAVKALGEGDTGRYYITTPLIAIKLTADGGLLAALKATSGKVYLDLTGCGYATVGTVQEFNGATGLYGITLNVATSYDKYSDTEQSLNGKNERSVVANSFRASTNLATVTFGSDVYKIAGWAFNECDALTYVTFPSGADWYSGSTLVDVTDPAAVAANLKTTGSGSEKVQGEWCQNGIFRKDSVEALTEFVDEDDGTPKYTVTFSAGADDAIGEVAALSGKATYVLPANGFTRTGYTFTGWATAENAGSDATVYKAGASFTPAADTTLYAQWVESAAKLTFAANGGSGTMAQLTLSDDTATLTANDFTAPSGKAFSQWNTEADGTGIGFLDGASVSVSALAALSSGGEITLYAQWGEEMTLAQAATAIANLTAGATGRYIIIEEDGEDGVVTSLDIKNTLRTALQSTAGKVFLDLTQVKYATVTNTQEFTSDSLVGISFDIATSYGSATGTLDSKGARTLYAYTFKNCANLVTVTLGKSVHTVKGEAFQGCTSLASVTFTNTARSWADSKDPSDPAANGTNLKPDGNWYLSGIYDTTQDTELEALAPCYTVSFDGNAPSGATVSGSMDAATSLALATITLPEHSFSVENYTFTGWSTSTDGTGTAYADKASISVSKDTTLYAQWVIGDEKPADGKYHAVTFYDTDLTTVLAVKYIEEGTAIADADYPTKNGWTAVWHAVKTNTDGSRSEGSAWNLTSAITSDRPLVAHSWSAPVSGTASAALATAGDIALSVNEATVSVTLAENAGTDEVSYAWRVDGSTVLGATGASYTLAASDSLTLAVGTTYEITALVTIRGIVYSQTTSILYTGTQQ